MSAQVVGLRKIVTDSVKRPWNVEQQRVAKPNRKKSNGDAAEERAAHGHA